MSYEIALLFAGAIAASEILLRLPLMNQIQIVTATAQRARTVLGSKHISDHWKETILPAYSVRIASRSILFFICLCVVVLPIGLVGLMAPGGIAQWLETLMQPLAMLGLCVTSIIYILVRTRLSRG
ncbi:MAG: hypothetical protein ABI395_04965 [Sphingobium sp.]